MSEFWGEDFLGVAEGGWTVEMVVVEGEKAELDAKKLCSLRGGRGAGGEGRRGRGRSADFPLRKQRGQVEMMYL